MDDQKKQKPLCKKRVRVRVTYTAIIEVVDETEKPIETDRYVEGIVPVDKAGFQKAFELVDTRRQAKQKELDNEYAQELERQEEALRQASLTIPEKIFGWFIGR